MLAGVFLTFLRSQPISVRRSFLRDHILGNLEHPDLQTIREALPADVRDALDLFVDVARRSKWGNDGR